MDTSGIADDEGMENAVFTYRWMAGGTDIPGVTGSNYMLVDDDEGRTIQVRVTFTDDLGNEETLTSVATEAVDAKPNAPSGSPMSEVRIRKSPARWMLPIRWWPTMRARQSRWR